MSTQAVEDLEYQAVAKELTPLGKRVEILRIERGVSKQRLARHAGTSRQQLWRVMTGKSELTLSLRDRLACALSVEPATLLAAGVAAAPEHTPASLAIATTAVTVSEYLTDAAHLAATIRTLPSGDGGRRLKRALLNALEDLAVDAERALPIDYSEIRRKVLAGEL
jgi:transcriptional regulator with XRE-family HTH domain